MGEDQSRAGPREPREGAEWVDGAIGLAISQARRVAEATNDFPHIFHEGAWQCTTDGVWTGGFWAGIFWLAWELRREDDLLAIATDYTERLLPRVHDSQNHDLGFMFFPTAVKAWQLTGDQRWRDAALDAARALAGQFNDKGGYIPGWGFFGQADWSNSVLVDTLMNLPLMVWASQQPQGPDLMPVVEAHARTSLAHHLRADGTVYHVYSFDPETGAPMGGETYQGLSGESTWARGQGWAITGLAILAGQTGRTDFVAASTRVAEAFVARLPDDRVAPWDFDAPGPDEPRDSSAGAIVSYGLLKLFDLTSDARWLHEANRLLRACHERCGNKGGPGGLLLHGTADLPHGLGIDGSTMYGDYYYLKALIALRAALAQQ